MHYFVRILSATLIMFVFSGCGGKSKYETENVKYETEFYNIQIEKLKFKEENILNTDMENDEKQWISDFENRVSEKRTTEDVIPNMHIANKVYCCNERMLSVVTEKYLYIKGAHGNTWWKSRNYDIKEEKYVTLSDMFYDEEYISVLNRIMNSMAESDGESYHDLWEEPKIKDGIRDNFYIDKNKLVIYFQPYELSYYAKGVVEFSIKADELRGYIKEEYLKMMCE